MQSSENESESENMSEIMSEESICSNDKIIRNMNPVEFFNQKELCYYRKINKFFLTCSTGQIETMIDIIKSSSRKNKEIPKSKISLRLLDWFVTKYPKKINLTIENETNDIEIFDVRMSYRAHLKSSKKKCFDPFRRRERFLYTFPGTTYTVETTLCQLNFFKWLFSYDVLTYVEKNLKQINKEMIISNKEEKEDKEKKKKSEESSCSSDKKLRKSKKSKDIKINASKLTDCDDVQIILKFD